MKIRIIQWNIKINCDVKKIASLIDEYVSGITLINLQEVSVKSYCYINNMFSKSEMAYSLNHRTPGKYEGRNRQMGVMTIAVGGNIINEKIVNESLFPERTLFTTIQIDKAIINNLTFHSLTGVDYKKAKSSNFASIAGFIHENRIDVLTCDANEPKEDSVDDDKLVFFDNRDKGRNASLLFGSNKVHDLKDTFKEYIKSLNSDIKAGYTHVTGKTMKRYDYIYCNRIWKIENSFCEYDRSIKATSDHAMVVSDIEI